MAEARKTDPRGQGRCEDLTQTTGLTFRRIEDRPDALGESPVWDAEAGCLWWIDGVAGVLHRRDAEGRVFDYRMNGHIGAIALAEDGNLVIALDHRVVLYDPEVRAEKHLLVLEGADPAMRLNDAKLDRQGRFLCAGMGRGGEPLGQLHQVDGACRHRVLAEGLHIGNGICFSPEGDVLYFADTPARKVFACDYDPATGASGPARLHIDTAPLEAGIDGATVDRAGNLWGALIRTGEIGCFSPQGTLITRIPAPVDLPSSLAFGGADMTTLFVTSIRDSGTGRAVSTHPDGGKLFAIDGLWAKGIAEARFRLTPPS